MPELTIAPPYVDFSRVDSNTCTMDSPMPELVLLTLCQSQLYPLVRDFGFELRMDTHLSSPCESGRCLPILAEAMGAWSQFRRSGNERVHINTRHERRQRLSSLPFLRDWQNTICHNL
jgi:hypothetical protein